MKNPTQGTRISEQARGLSPAKPGRSPAQTSRKPYPTARAPHTPGTVQWPVLLLALCLSSVAASCAKQPEPPDPNAIVPQSFEQGGVSLDMALTRRDLTPAQQTALRLDLTADEDLALAWPNLPEEMGGFTVVDERFDQNALVDDGRIRRTRHVTLEPFLPGDYVIPTLSFAWTNSAGKQLELLTEPISVRVRSVLPPETTREAMHEIAPPVSLPVPFFDSLTAKLILGMTVVTLLAALAAYLLHRNRTGPDLPPPSIVPPDEMALNELAQLESRNLPGKGLIKPFYQSISDILRRYIEGQFGIDAPEQTTEEFLASLAFSCEFKSEHQQLLRAFLTHCDLVKFAEHKPTSVDVSETTESCRRFILHTRHNADPKTRQPEPRKVEAR